jgi:hypothetical protein
MTGFLAEIGQKLADRWVALLAVPGLLYVAAVTVASVLSQGHAVSYPVLNRKITAWAADPVLKSAGGAVLIIAAILAGSVVAALTAAAGGRFAEALWTLPGRRPPASWLTKWRQDRSRRYKAVADTSSDPSEVRRAIAPADQICLIGASRPTWIGDRLRACQVRIEQVYGLDLNVAWPRLWLIVPDVVRTELGTARDAFSAAARLTAWAVLYLILAIWWWPAALIAMITGVVAIGKARIATGNLTDLVESAVDLYNHDLAAQLGEETTGVPAQVIGQRDHRAHAQGPLGSEVTSRGLKTSGITNEHRPGQRSLAG